jgi:1,2-phenylacetyl-CoA epoxidase catalytic subunit
MASMVKNYRRTQPDRLHDVRENARKVGVLYSVEVELTRLVGAWIARTPELPEKLALARMLYEDADHARLLGQRLLELRVAESRLDSLSRRTAPAFKTLEALDRADAFFDQLFRVVKPALLADYCRHLDAAPPYVDEPSVRLIRQIIREEEEHLEAGLALLAERRRAPGTEVDYQQLWDLEAEGGGFTDGEWVGREPEPLPSPVWPGAVTKLGSAEAMPAYPSDFDEAMRRCVHDLVFSETEALDIFGRYVYELGPELPWLFTFESARIAWDEARHVELLLSVLERYGGRVGSFPAKAPGYEEYVRQPTTLQKLIMVNVIAEGEVSTDTQTQHREAFRQLGDHLSALFKDYEMADEINHGQFGLRWAHWLAEKTGENYEKAFAAAHRALEEFKSSHDAEGELSPIPLLRLGVDETGSGRVVNTSAKRLVGFTDDEIAALTANAKETIEDASI